MSRLQTFVAAAALFLGACGKKEDPPTAPAPPPAVVAAPAQDLPSLPKPRPPSPIRLMASANQGVQVKVAEGWPVVVEAQLFLERGLEKSVKLAGASGPWSDALSLRCLAADGTDRAALFKRSFASAATIEITKERSGVAVWVLETVDAAALPPGPHRLRVSIDAAKVGGAVPEGQTSNEVLLTVEPRGATETPFMVQDKCLARMTASSWSGAPDKALETANAYLAEHPKDVAVMFMKGNVQRAQGKKEDALASYEAALRSAEAQKKPGDENFAIMEVIVALRRELAPKK